MTQHRIGWAVLCGLAVAISLGGVAYAYENGETILIDNFDDGNDDGWTREWYLPNDRGGPPVFDATSGAYHLMSSGLVPVGAFHFVISVWDGSADPLFANGLMRSKVRVDAEGTGAYLFMRGTGYSYYFAADTATNKFSIGGGERQELYAPLAEPAFNVGEEWYIEGGAVGDQLSMKVWRVGDPEPSAPQLVVTDTDLVAGWMGLGAYVSSPPYPEPAFVDATFDDIYFSFTFREYPWTTVRKPERIYTAIDNDFDNLGDTFSDRSMQPGGGVGEADTETSNTISRLIAKFLLPEGAESMLKSATLRFFLQDIMGSPAGAVSVFHSVADNDFFTLASDYEDDSYEDTELDLVGPAGEEGRYYDVDVTDLVLTDYAADGANPVSAFRLQINEAEFSEDNLSHRYVFTMPGAETNHPELVLTFIPEPSTIALGGLAVLGLLSYGWRRGARGI